MDIIEHFEQILTSYAFMVNFRAYFKDIVDNSKWVQSFFFLRGEIPGYRHTQVAENTPQYTPSEMTGDSRKVI